MILDDREGERGERWERGGGIGERGGGGRGGERKSERDRELIIIMAVLPLTRPSLTSSWYTDALGILVTSSSSSNLLYNKHYNTVSIVETIGSVLIKEVSWFQR